MVLDQLPFDYLSSIRTWIQVTGILTALSLLTILLQASINQGSFGRGFQEWKQQLAEIAQDVVQLSMSRLFSLIRHSVKESFHRKVLYVFVVFAILFLFAGWYIDSSAREQVKYYVTFVLKATSWLTLLVALLLSCFSLPSDINSKTIHTIITKPVRRSEIIIGRIFGFGLLGTAILILMGMASYLFVIRGVDHSHQIVANRLVFFTGQASVSEGHSHQVSLDGEGNGMTDDVAGHVHQVREFQIQTESAPELGSHTHSLQISSLQIPDFQGRTDEQAGHFHLITINPSEISELKELWSAGDKQAAQDKLDSMGTGTTDLRLGHYHNIDNYEVGGAEDQLVARSPVYGRLHFRGRSGENLGQEGLSVGNPWEYRDYIEGGSRMAAVWSFNQFPASGQIGETLQLETTFEVYRSMKGNVEDQILAEIVLRNPKTGTRSRPFLLGIQEYHMTTLDIPQSLTDSEGNDVDIFQDLVAVCGQSLPEIPANVPEPILFKTCGHCGARNGLQDQNCNAELVVEVSCATPQQYIGMAQADLYLRTDQENPFYMNFVKCLTGIWLQMLLIVCVGVVASTFLSGPVAALTTLAVILAGLTMPFMREVAMGDLPGAVESLVRLISGESELARLDPTPWLQFAIKVDQFMMYIVWAVTYCLPDLGGFDMAQFVANGFDIPFSSQPEQGIRGLSMNILMTLGYCLPYTLLGYLFLKVREIAR